MQQGSTTLRVCKPSFIHRDDNEGKLQDREDGEAPSQESQAGPE